MESNINGVPPHPQDIELWRELYFKLVKQCVGVTKDVKDMRLECFRNICEMCNSTKILEKYGQGYCQAIFSEFENAILYTHNDVVSDVLQKTPFLIQGLWKMCLSIGDFMLQHRVFLLTSYFVTILPIENIVILIRQMSTCLSTAFAKHLLPNLVTTPFIKEHLSCSRRFLNKLNNELGFDAGVISVESSEMYFNLLKFYPSQLQQGIWIDFNINEKTISVWCMNQFENEVNFVFKLKNIILGEDAPIMTIEPYSPVKFGRFNEYKEVVTKDGLVSFKLTENGYRCAQMYIKKFQEIKESKQQMIKKINK